MQAKYERWEPWEDAFLAETYTDTSWQLDLIAEKLERSVNGLKQRAGALGLHRPMKKTLDYKAIATLSAKGLSQARIAKELQCSQPGVARALKVMKREVEHG